MNLVCMIRGYLNGADERLVVSLRFSSHVTELKVRFDQLSLATSTRMVCIPMEMDWREDAQVCVAQLR